MMIGCMLSTIYLLACQPQAASRSFNGSTMVACRNLAKIVRLLVMQSHPGPAKMQKLRQGCMWISPVHLTAAWLLV